MFDNSRELEMVHEFKMEQVRKEAEYRLMVKERARKKRSLTIDYTLLKLARHIKSFGSDLEVKYEKRIKQKACA